MSTLGSIESKGLDGLDRPSHTWTYALAVKLVTLEAKALVEGGNEDLPTDPFAH
jgi:hypothetical protein